jgi:hypothetical protein
VLELMQRLATESRPSVVANALSLGVCAVPTVSSGQERRARALLAFGLGAGERVGVCAERVGI